MPSPEFWTNKREADSETNPKPVRKFNTGTPHAARVWNYWLDGKDNFAVDREAGDRVAEIYPTIVDLVRAERAFLKRAVRYLVSEAGIRQFLDIGAGLPTVENTHEVAQRIAPDSRIVYVDNDPLVLSHARALLVGTPEGVVHYVDADLRDPDAILRESAHALDLDQPVAIMLLCVLVYLEDTDDACAIVKRLLSGLPSGSHIVITHSTNEITGAADDDVLRERNAHITPPITLRSVQQIERFFEGLELLDPGIVPCPRWRPEPALLNRSPEVDEFCGVGRKR